MHTQRLLFLSTIGLFTLIIAGCGSQSPRGIAAADQAITSASMKRHLFFLASDSLKGRNTPSPELDTAASYIAAVFARAGLRPINGSYFQTFPLNRVSLGDTNTFELMKDGQRTPYDIRDDFTPFDMTGDKDASGDVVFAGYGITAPEYSYDDYAGLDVKGKVVFVLRHEPGEEDSTSVFKGKRETEYANVAKKVRIAIDHGAVAVLVATDPLNHTLLSPRGFPWPSLSKIIPPDALPYTLAAEESEKIPVIHVGPKVIEALFGSIDSLRSLQASIDSSVRPRSFPLKGWTARVHTSTRTSHVETRNVVGLVEGRDSVLKKEVVVIGAHYDHVGYKKNHAPGEDYIFNGADDNASGTTAVLGVAEAFAQAGERPRRSVLLMAFAGEEKGLFGSEYYNRKPLIPLSSTVGMLNMDMVGRNSEDSLLLIGTESSPAMTRLTHEENNAVGFILVEKKLAAGGSDHQSFSKRNIPVIFYHSDLHPDYHQVSDNPETINFDKVAKVARLVYRTAWRVANEEPQQSQSTH
jgi:hypothetical protein